MGTKVLLVGVDGGDRELVERRSAEGRMPTIARIRREGHWGILAPQPGLGDDAGWSSFSTGLNPGRHGRSYHDRFAADGVTMVPFSRLEMTVAPFWDALVREGRRVAMIDVPKSPMGADAAFVVADWMTHGEEESAAQLSPAARDHPLHGRFVADPTWDCDRDLTTAAATTAFERRVVARARERTATLRRLLQSRDWDLFTAVFAEAHCAGHRCWRDHDPGHPEHDAGRRAATGDVVERVYAEVDRSIAELIDEAGADAVVVVFSIQGMGPNYRGTHLLEEVFRRATSASPGTPALRGVDRLRRCVPPALRRRAPAPAAALGRSIRVRTEQAKPYRALDIDLASTAIRVASAHTGSPEGARGVPPEDQEHLRGLLGALVDPDTGRPIVDDIVFTADQYPGPAADDFVDALVLWRADAPINGAASDRVGVIRAPQPPMRSGNHRGGGWFAVAGPGIASTGLTVHGEVVDLAPTIAALLGITLDDVDGHPIPTVVAPTVT